MHWSYSSLELGHWFYVKLTIAWVNASVNLLRLSDVYVSLDKVIIGLDNGWSLVRHQATIWTNDGSGIARLSDV